MVELVNFRFWWLGGKEKRIGGYELKLSAFGLIYFFDLQARRVDNPVDRGGKSTALSTGPFFFFLLSLLALPFFHYLTSS